MDETELEDLRVAAEEAQLRYREALESWNQTPMGKRARCLDRAETWDTMADSWAAKGRADEAMRCRAKAAEQREQARAILEAKE